MHHRNRLAIPAALAVVAWGAAMMMAPPPLPSAAETARTTAQSTAAKLPEQSLTVDGTVPDISVVRDGYSATDGAQTLAANGTNHDWAKLVLVFAGWPTTESNITVITRWMRQENGVDNWWNRNNPLNNGWGSGGGSGLGSYDSLVTAAENCADALHRNSGYTAIAAGLAASAPTGEIEAAIWASPWASSHYANGSHWSSRPVDVVKAPADAWG
ncbi:MULTISPECIES: hypothetical protein [unclassified Leifsonia]|uniref:hypothetical protein n=1 Tax=unclassified Leifsonia TaxID=2663824 RepID=UPI0006F37263|nr:MULTISPECIES: hypothetical protein [unclassified Leifsonia]KQX07485.1 hypothetical protein ASC59_06945 [Leifsonia sp. Root1293]KRA11767.1 hypothetical protein ASD61_06945 [Leifsonia sp. Root60]